VTLAINLFLLELLVVTAVAVIRLRNLFAAVMLTGIYSLLSACWFTLQDAVDVAFTEAAVGAGISTVLMLGTLSLTQSNEKAGRSGHPILGFAVVMLTGAALFCATFDMPHYGDPSAPIHTHPIYEEYVHASYDKFHIPNMVTSVLASYRGYDTFGETTVILTAGVGVMLLLSRRREEEGTP
jgi:multicomponent Na+:H+ antiporter subunit B